MLEEEGLYGLDFVLDRSARNETPRGVVFSGESCLAFGETEAEAHDRIRSAIRGLCGDYKVSSRWLCLEDQPWDAEFSDSDNDDDDDDDEGKK